MADKKKLTTTAVALATSAALLLGGTFAWQSINQTALNEASDIVNPGGRLHNDMWYVSATENNNDVYVENFADDEIFARVRLGEYMEIVMNKGSDAEAVEIVAGRKLLNGAEVTDKATDKDTDYDYEYATHYFGEVNATDEWWNWDTDGNAAGDVYYMPTFNLNKDSLAPDLNGLYADRVGGISDREAAQYVDNGGSPLEDYEGYADGDTKTGYEIYDGDVNSDDEVGTDPDVLADLIAYGSGSAEYAAVADAVVIPDEQVQHEAAPVGESRGLISLTDWLALNEGVYSEGTHGNYWVYDDTADEDGDGAPDGDGWVYWSSPIGKDGATGLLLDGIELAQVMDDSWYYAIEVTGQFITADDLGKPADAAAYGLRNTEVGGTGFYRDGETVTENALTLLSLIGVDVTGDGENEDDGPEAPKTVYVPELGEEYPTYHVNVYDTIETVDCLVMFTYQDGQETVELEEGTQYTLSNSSDNNWMYTIVLLDETLAGKTIAAYGNSLIGRPCGAYFVVDGVADLSGGETGGEENTETLSDINFVYGEASATVYRGTTYTFGNVATGGFPVYPNAAAITTEGATSYVSDDMRIVIAADEPCDTLSMDVTYTGDDGDPYTETVTLTVLGGEETESAFTVEYSEPGDAVIEKDGTYYVMYLKASLNGEALDDTSMRYLRGAVYEDGGEEALYTKAENLGFDYDSGMGSFYFKIKMEDLTLTSGTAYDLCVTYANGEETYTSDRLSYTYVGSGSEPAYYVAFSNGGMMASDGTAKPTLLDADGNPYEGDVTWSEDEEDLKIMGEYVNYMGDSPNMELKAYTVTAETEDGSTYTGTLYVYNATVYEPLYPASVTSPDTGDTYYVFDYLGYTPEEKLGLVATQICVYRHGDDVSAVYYYGDMSNFAVNEGLAQQFDSVYEEGTMSLVRDITSWPVEQ